MKLNVAAMAMTVGIIWGVAVFSVAVANMIWPSYGGAFLEWTASIYPGYHATASFGSVVTGTLYALVDGAGAGAVVAWLYNMFAGRGPAV